MSEKSNHLRCTLAANIIPVGKEGCDILPPHITIAPPFEVLEKNYSKLIRKFYNSISVWSSLLYDDDEKTILELEESKQNFGTDDKPLLVDCIKSTEQAGLLTALREMIKEDTEEVCGKRSTKSWIVGELHISELEQKQSKLESSIAINSLTLFIKRNKKWCPDETFYWND